MSFINYMLLCWLFVALVCPPKYIYIHAEEQEEAAAPNLSHFSEKNELTTTDTSPIDIETIRHTETFASTPSITTITTTTTTTTTMPIETITTNQKSSINTTDDKTKKNCFYAEPELCLNMKATQSDNDSQSVSCQCRLHPTLANSWYCCNISQVSMIYSCSNLSSWTNLHIHNMTTHVNLSNNIYQTLVSLTIEGNISYISGSFQRMSTIKCLNISNSNISEISQRALSSVQNLKYLDISHNNLTSIPKLNLNQNITIDLRGNKYMLCTSLREAVYRDSFKFVDANGTFCLFNSKYNWFNTTDKISLTQLYMTRRFQSECPVIPGHGNCSCAMEQMLIVGDQSAKIFCSVDCSNMGLTELPANLPENTFSLNVSNNNITNIAQQFQSNPRYQSIVILDADNNQITAINELEGTEFMYHFQKLHLKNNALSKIPEYLLNNIWEGTFVGRNIHLGGNKLICDCNSAKVLKTWLLERSKDIPDNMEIGCRNLPQTVRELQEIKVCQSPHDWTDYIIYLIITEAILLLALITKVSYDYWVFKTAGYLPWPASKMPKLPCDWLCE